MATPPTIPPRPTRAQNSSSTASPLNDAPKIPPRPKRNLDRSVSPNRDTFARSPLNDPAFLHTNQHKESNLSVEAPARPPSVSLPSLGEEGNEYASFEDLSKTLTNESAGSPQTKNVAGDLPLYAPKASVPSSTAKSRIQVVTRTDSSQAAAAGFGKLSVDDKPSTADSGRSGSSTGGRSRPASILKEDDEQGIPEIGVQVPMYPNAGDVQAPTPSPYDQPQQPPSSAGSARPGRHHGRTKSGREIFAGPPGSYGMHGHGVISNDEFSQKWYAKHPEDLKREKAGEYGPHIQENRKDYHWKGDDLDKLVHQAGVKGVGMGTSQEAIGTPDEHIGYIASEEYASRMASPRPSSGRPASISGKANVNTDSPLRQAVYPTEEPSTAQPDESAKDDVIHIDPPSHRSSKIHGGGYDPPTEDLGPEGGNTEEEGGWISERGYGVPILASDELEKHPKGEWRQPAVSPELQRDGDDDHIVNEGGAPSYVTKAKTHSRSSSRNSGQRAIVSPTQFDRSGTPLEATKEYEPLFPEDEEPKKPKSVVDKLKRPDLARHQFPSQDVWEDTPSSLQLETTVETHQAPDEPETPGGELPAAKITEKPQTEELRKDPVSKDDEQSFLEDKSKRYVNKNLSREHLDQPTRPGMQQRFPSQDIWEDAPDHGRLETTVSAPQSEETHEYAEDSPVAEKPSIPARPLIPGRPARKADISPIDKKAPIIPERPKPQVPARPSKPLTKSSEKVPTLESQAENEAPQPKAKPPVPARPGGSKIAALQSSFLKDLNSKLGLGPQAPKVKEPEPEKEEEPAKPLQDARKGRAKGPQRRKPTASPTPAATVTAEVAVPSQSLVIAPVSTIWSIGDDGEVDVPAAKVAAKLQEALKVPEKKEVAPVVQDTAEAEPEEALLTKTDTKSSEVAPATEPEQAEPAPEPAPAPVQTESAKTVDPPAKVGVEEDTEAKAEVKPEAEVDAVGGVPLEGKLSAENPLKTAEEVKEHKEVKDNEENVVVKSDAV